MHLFVTLNLLISQSIGVITSALFCIVPTDLCTIHLNIQRHAERHTIGYETDIDKYLKIGQMAMTTKWKSHTGIRQGVSRDLRRIGTSRMSTHTTCTVVLEHAVGGMLMRST